MVSGLAAEPMDRLREVINVALAHVAQKQTEAGYARSHLFQRA